MLDYFNAGERVDTVELVFKLDWVVSIEATGDLTLERSRLLDWLGCLLDNLMLSWCRLSLGKLRMLGN